MMKMQFPLLAIAVMLGGCSSFPIAGKNDDRTSAHFTTDVVKRQDLTGYSFFDGKLVIPESARATAHSPYDAPVASVSTSLGKPVQRGQAIVRLTIPAAAAAATAAKVNVSSAQSDYAAERAASSAPVDEAKRALAVARAEERTARDAVANGGAADVASATQIRVDAEVALTQAQRELQQMVQPSRDAARQASLALKFAREDAAKGIVRAPISGTVVSLEAKAGLMAAAKFPLATIVNFNAVRVQGLVPAELKDLVVKGSRVIIALNGESSDPLDGWVVDVGVAPPTEGQTSAGYLAVIQFLNPGSIVQPNISVKRIGVKAGTAKDVLVVPVGALVAKDGKSIVNVKNGEAWTETPVVTGMSDGALVEIKSGLTKGTIVRVLVQPETVR